MNVGLIILLLSLLLAVAGGCRTSSTPSTTASTPLGRSEANAPSTAAQTPPVAANESAGKAKVDACALLTSKEIETIQGEAVKETKLSGHSTGGFAVSQCFFTLPTFNKSVSLMLAQRGEGAGARDPRDFWRDTFQEEKSVEKENDRDSDRNKKKRGEEEESSRPEKVTGIGDDAYWTGSRVGGALYVLKGNAYVRVSVGGPADQADKIKRSKTLAQKVLQRL